MSETNAHVALLVPKTRRELLKTLALMPEEAFSWFVLWASGSMTQYPDGIGGFMKDSQISIKELRAAAEDYMKANG